ncbi:MAG: hypothetical protein [Caudoviricetes sp.]|nr:MAG: hypothetical protein [Caudoviricetes sp.]
MIYNLRYTQTLCTNVITGITDITQDLTQWKRFNDDKLLFNLHKFLIEVNRIDILQRHFDPSCRDQRIQTDWDVNILNGKPKVSRWTTSSTAFRDETDDLIAMNQDLWNKIKTEKISWDKQKMFTFIEIRSIEI